MLKCGKWNQVAVGDGKSKVGRASLVEFLCHVRAVGRCFIGDSFTFFSIQPGEVLNFILFEDVNWKIWETTVTYRQL